MKKGSMLEVLDRRVENIRQMAAANFAEHVIKADHTWVDHYWGHWIVGRPGTAIYGFEVTVQPGHLFVVGDVGELIVSRAKDMIGWTTSAIGSIEYFASKVPQSIPTKEFDPEMAAAWIREQLSGDDEYHHTECVKENLRAILHDVNEISECDLCSRLADSGAVDGCDWPELRNWNSNFLWCREAILCFLRLRDQNRVVA